MKLHVCCSLSSQWFDVSYAMLTTWKQWSPHCPHAAFFQLTGFKENKSVCISMETGRNWYCIIGNTCWHRLDESNSWPAALNYSFWLVSWLEWHRSALCRRLLPAITDSGPTVQLADIPPLQSVTQRLHTVPESSQVYLPCRWAWGYENWF